MIDGWGISSEIALIWMSLDFTDDQSTLVQVMAWCRQATSHYLIQCWPRSLSPYGVTRPQWVNSFWPCETIWQHRSGSTLFQVMVCCWRHRAITWTNVDWSSERSSGIHLRAISLTKSISKMGLRITFLTLLPNLPGASKSIEINWDTFPGMHPVQVPWESFLSFQLW